MGITLLADQRAAAPASDFLYASLLPAYSGTPYIRANVRDSRANAKLDEVKSQLTTEELAEATVRAQSLAGKTHRLVWQSPFH